MMKRPNLDEAQETRCLRCGGSIVVEMDGLWSYRACARCGRAEEPRAGGFPFSIAFFSARG
jgi:hypothetical protein